MDVDYPIGIQDGKRPQQQDIGKAVNGRIRAYTDSERTGRNHDESWAFGQQANRKEEIFEHGTFRFEIYEMYAIRRGIVRQFGELQRMMGRSVLLTGSTGRR